MHAPPSATEQATLVLHTVIVDLFLIAYFGYKLRGFRSKDIPVTHSRVTYRKCLLHATALVLFYYIDFSSPRQTRTYIPSRLYSQRE